MCIAVYKPAGSKMPSKKIFSNCFSNNDDGAGFMFPLNGKVHLEKGFMSFTAFKKGLKDAIKRYGLCTKDIPMVFHFRIQSQGGVRADLTHPFPLASSYDTMRELKGDYDVAVVHNGIIDFESSYSTKIDYSDTMSFVKNVLHPLIFRNKNYYKNKTLMRLIDHLLDGNRFLIMQGDGHVEKFGSWSIENGVYYSNTSYQHKWFSSSFAGGWKSVGSCLSSSYNDVITRHDTQQYITKQQEKDFLDTGILRCEDCGDEMFIEYDYREDKTIASCYGCGKEVILTPKAEDFAWANGLVAVDDYGYDYEDTKSKDEDDEYDDKRRVYGYGVGGGY